MLADLRRIYRESLKPADSLFNLYVARPLAAPVVAALVPTRVTPNQVTFGSIGVFLLAALAFVALPGVWGIALGTLLVEASYVLDCADGQLARITRRTSPVGAELDFLMDELKAYLLVGSLAARLYLHEGGGPGALLFGLGALVAVGSAIALTKFVRGPEYAAATGQVRAGHGESAGRAREGTLWPIKTALRFVTQYPASLPLFAVAGRFDLFLILYGALHVLYAGQTALGVGLRLGRPHPPEAS